MHSRFLLISRFSPILGSDLIDNFLYALLSRYYPVAVVSPAIRCRRFTPISISLWVPFIRLPVEYYRAKTDRSIAIPPRRFDFNSIFALELIASRNNPRNRYRVDVLLFTIVPEFSILDYIPFYARIRVNHLVYTTYFKEM